MKIPTKEECLKVLNLNKVPENIVGHLQTVHDFSMKVCNLLEGRGIKINKKLVAAAALLHDVFKLKSENHEIEGANYIESLGYKEIADIIIKHGLKNLHDPKFQPKSWEEKAVFYADKRCNGKMVVSVDERFEDIKQRYKKEGVEPELKFTKKIEEEILQGRNI